jgi:hypothetical protein
LPLAIFCVTAALAENRTYDGSGNNVDHPIWGQAGVAYNRLAPAAYGDGISAPAGSGRPGPREISNAVGAQAGAVPNQRGLSGFVYAFGQFLNHDIDLTRTNAEQLLIPTPPDDPVFHGNSLGIFRSTFDANTGTGVDNPRQQIDSTTSYIDASNVYGADELRANSLRAVSGLERSAKLITGTNNHLPRNSVVPIEMVRFLGPANNFSAGDIRANENVALASLHTLFMREHNRLVDELSAAHPMWNSEELYQRARKIVGAELQVITYQEFLPALLGPYAPSSHGMYDPSVDATMINEFATVFLRVGHSMLPTHFRRMRNDNTPAPGDPVRLGATEFAVTPLLSGSQDLDFNLKGLSIEPQAEVDTLIDDGLRNVIVANLDLFAADIQRARDHGLADYNSMRAAYGLPVLNSFAEVTSDPALQAKLHDLYGDVDNMDALIGMLAEDHLADAAVGPLAAAGLVEQFTRLRDGDRFWYEHDADFTAEEIATLQATRLSDIIQRNTSLTTLQANVFFVPVAAPLLTGDYNNDGEVNAADYLVWRNGLGFTYVQNDYQAWRAHFGDTTAGASVSEVSAPEPTSAMLLLAALMATFRGRSFQFALITQE